jgi:allophanate hydrolase subunit 1
MPSGWYIVGRTPAAMYDPRRRFPFLLDAGDRVRFAPIDRAEFDRLAAAAADAGTYEPTAAPP